jgi:hypothetical protein
VSLPLFPSFSNPSSIPGAHPSRSRVSEPPLAITDVRIIFRNISDIAVLSDTLIAKLEKAIEEEGNGVGEVFLEVVSLSSPRPGSH